MVFLMSWNVAGLSTVVHRIHGSYSSSSSTDKNKKSGNAKKSVGGQCRVMAGFFERHGSPDIVCLQEAKIPKPQLCNRSEPRGCANVEGYESFWSCRLDDPTKGMNGVVTYAKKGTVIAADAFPLGNPKLDDQGRCVMTDHGNFVVFNVYVPASGGSTVEDKLQFLQALRRAMKKQRDIHQKAVILTGDLNISHGKLDVYWKDQVLHVNDILQQVQQQQQATQQDLVIPAWKQQLAQAWPMIVETMKTKQVVPSQTTNTKTGETFNKFRLQVTLKNPTRTVFLGKNYADEGWCLHGYDFDTVYHYTDPETDDVLPICGENVVSLSILQELMLKIAKVEWKDDTTLREIANSSDAGRSRISPYRQWLSTLLSEDDMVDTFRHFYPTAEGRFTCWHQHTNKRYVNDGARIDYAIVDRSLLPFLEKGGALRTGENFTAIDTADANSASSIVDTGGNTMDPLTEDASLAAATARGQFRMAAFEGGGIAEATQRALDTQFGPRHTGVIYTPPSFSDHVAVSLLLGDSTSDTNDANDDNPERPWRADDWGNLVLNEKDPKTKKAQPHKVQKSIASFFSNNVNASSTSKVAATSKTTKTKLPQKRPATVQSFFKPKKPVGSQNETPNASQSQQGDNTRVVVRKTQVTKTTSSSANGRKKKGAAPSILNHFTKK